MSSTPGSRLVRVFAATAALCLTAPPATPAAPIAERVTVANAGSRLFGGSDADGGIDDWYLSNGVVQAIIDDVGPQADLVPLLGPGAPAKVSEFAFTGCSVIDLGLAGKNNDHLSQLFTVGGLSTSNFILYDGVAASTTPTSATLTCTGTLLGFATGATPVPPANLEVTTEYTAKDADPFLTITTTVVNTHPTNAAAGLGGFLDASVWTLRAQVPFSPLPGRGFRHQVLDFAAIALALELPAFAAAPAMVRPEDGVIDPVTGAGADENAYGFLGEEVSLDQDGPGPNPPVVTPVDQLFGISSNLLTAFGNFPVGSLQPGGVLRYTRRVYVGGRNDVASVANLMLPELAARQGWQTGTVSGDVAAAGQPDIAASAVATRTGGPAIPNLAANVPVTHFRTDAAGAFAGVVLPVGTYDIEFRTPERDPVVVTDVMVAAAANTPVAVPAFGDVATLELRAIERVSGPDPLIPVKVVIKGRADTPDPRLRRDLVALAQPTAGPDIDLRAETFGGGPGQGDTVFLADGTATVRLRPGKYYVYASRGPEYTIRRRAVTLAAGKTKAVKLALRRIVDTTGWIAGDFHIHSARSLDSSAPPRDRVAAFAGEGVEVMVSTDHDFHLDYAPVIDAMGLGGLVTSIVGNEMTGSVPNPPAFPDSIGHINAWPLPVQPTARRDGAIEDEFVAPNFVFKRLRDQGADVVQYNHPRAGVSGITSIGFFNNVGYDPDLPITAAPNDLLLDDDVLGPGMSGVANPDGIRNIDFDVMEVANGTDVPGYLAVRRDWFSLLNQTDFATVPFIAGTGTSDTHRVTLESAGYARTYVGGAGDGPASLSVATFDANVKAGNMMATTGPFITFSAESGATAGLGQTLVPASSTVTLRIAVRASNWIPVEEVRVIANGFTALTFDASSTPAVKAGPNQAWSQSRKRVLRFDAAVPVTVSQDTYFVVEAGARLTPLPTPGGLANDVVPGLVPFAFTNPIFVDVAGDGFDPPGLPVMAHAAPVADERAPAFACIERADRPWYARLAEQLRGGPFDMAAAWVAGAEAHACGKRQTEALTGRALSKQVEQDRAEPSEEYFPLHRFTIPPSAIEDAVRALPEPDRTRLEAERRRMRGTR